MRLIGTLILSPFLVASAFAQQAGLDSIATFHKTIVDVQNKQVMTPEDLGAELSTANNIVLGEEHYNNQVQNAQAGVMSLTLKQSYNFDKFTLAWEFFNTKDQNMIDHTWNYVVENKLTIEKFVNYFQKNEKSVSYVPIFEVARVMGGQVLATNLTRDQKRPVSQGGIENIDPLLLPPDFELGSANYFERFKAAMGGHMDVNSLENFYDAQCLTDDVIAYTILEESNYDQRFLIVGSFHSDYNDGVVERLKKRAPNDKTVSVKIMNVERMTKQQALEALTHAQYGNIADFVVFVNEPKS